MKDCLGVRPPPPHPPRGRSQRWAAAVHSQPPVPSSRKYLIMKLKHTR